MENLILLQANTSQTIDYGPLYWALGIACVVIGATAYAIYRANLTLKQIAAGWKISVYPTSIVEFGIVATMVYSMTVSLAPIIPLALLVSLEISAGYLYNSRLKSAVEDGKIDKNEKIVLGVLFLASTLVTTTLFLIFSSTIGLIEFTLDFPFIQDGRVFDGVDPVTKQPIQVWPVDQYYRPIEWRPVQIVFIFWTQGAQIIATVLEVLYMHEQKAKKKKTSSSSTSSTGKSTSGSGSSYWEKKKEEEKEKDEDDKSVPFWKRKKT